ncbi:MAG: hypothetical protein TUN42_06290 [Dehalogenimonas sp.]
MTLQGRAATRPYRYCELLTVSFELIFDRIERIDRIVCAKRVHDWNASNPIVSFPQNTFSAPKQFTPVDILEQGNPGYW